MPRGAHLFGSAARRRARPRRSAAVLALATLFASSSSSIGGATAAAAERPGRQLGRVTVLLHSPCEDLGDDNRWRLPVCSPACLKQVRQWRFWFTNYNVDWSAGKGEHQGIGLFGYEYDYDSRFLPADGVVPPPWDPAVAPGNEPTFAARAQRPEPSGATAELTRSALCAPPRPLLERRIYNHGRTIAERPSGSWSEDAGTLGIPVEVAGEGVISAGPNPRPVFQDADSSPARAAAATQRCLEQITDGFCDSVCGNCSYVLPKEEAIGFWVRDVRGQALQFTRTEGEGGHTAIRYARTDPNRAPWPQVLDTALGEWAGLRDPFTHCLPEDGRQGLATLLVLFTPDGATRGRVITGLYGHNSNADAEAEYLAFQACRKSATDRGPFLTACEVCGNRQRAADGGEAQSPCLDLTNTAASKWSRYDGHHNVDDWSLGCPDPSGQPCGNPNPVCRDNGQTVFGM